MKSYLQRFAIVVIATLILVGCNYPRGTASTIAPESSPTIYFMTLSALQTKAVMTATSQGVAGIPSPIPVAPIPLTGGTPSAIGTPGVQNSVIINDTLCWQGPGARFIVVSAIFKGTRVEVIGRATIPGWWIVRNPTYFDPCWLQAANIQLDPTLYVAGLPLFSPPSPPMTATATEVPSLQATLPGTTATPPSGTTNPTLVPTTPPTTAPTTVPPTASPPPAPTGTP